MHKPKRLGRIRKNSEVMKLNLTFSIFNMAIKCINSKKIYFQNCLNAHVVITISLVPIQLQKFYKAQVNDAPVTHFVVSELTEF